jgi:hypothetical protein
MVARAVHKIGHEALKDFETGKHAWQLAAIAFTAATFTVMRVNFFLTLLLAAVLGHLAFRTHVARAAGAALIVLSGVAYGLYVAYVGVPSAAGTFGSISADRSLGGWARRVLM